MVSRWFFEESQFLHRCFRFERSKCSELNSDPETTYSFIANFLSHASLPVVLFISFLAKVSQHGFHTLHQCFCATVINWMSFTDSTVSVLCDSLCEI